MKNKDFIALKRAEILNKMNAAVAANDSEKFSEAFMELCQEIEQNVLEQAKELVNQNDANVLAQRGVRQLTSTEKEYYEKVIDAMKSSDPKQALNNIETVFPETIIDSVFEELTTNHPLLSKLHATTVTGLTRMMLNTNGEQKAAWGKLTDKIIEELTSGFKEVDVTQDKLSAFLPVSKAMLDLGPAWLDKYVREVLIEALANGLEYGVVNGTGKDEPIGMTRQVGDGVNVVGGEYPTKEPIKMTALNMVQLGNVTSIMARNSKGQARNVSDLIMLVNPVDYWKKILPATRALTPDGIYVSTVPIPMEIIQSAAVEEGTAVYGMAGKYFLGAGMSKNGKIEYSDQYHFLEDERIYLIKLYAYGFALDNNAFVVLDIDKLQPVRFEVVNKEEQHVDNSFLSDLKIGSLSLTPKFDANTETYTVTTSAATNTITAFPEAGTANIEITVGDVKVTNGGKATWNSGANTVKVKVTDGSLAKTYTVTVTKE